ALDAPLEPARPAGPALHLLRDRLRPAVRRRHLAGLRRPVAPGVPRPVGRHRGRPQRTEELSTHPWSRTMNLIRADLDALPSYVPGRTVPGAIKLASNEVPYGPLPGVPEAIAEAVSLSHRYPDLAAVALREKLSTRLGVDPARIATGCGSGALTEHLPRATCAQPGDELPCSRRSFEAYPIIAQSTGATSVRVPNRSDHGHDLPAMAAALTPRTRLAFVCNPNNPTGTAIGGAELDAFLDA